MYTKREWTRRARLGGATALALSVFACAQPPSGRPLENTIGSNQANPSQGGAASGFGEAGNAKTRRSLPANAIYFPPEPGDLDFEPEAAPAPAPAKATTPRELTPTEARRIIETSSGHARFWAIQGNFSGAYDIQFNKAPVSAKLTPNGAVKTFTAALVYQPEPDEDDPTVTSDEIVLAVGRGLGSTMDGEQVCDWYWTSGFTYTGKVRLAPWPTRYKASDFERIYRDMSTDYYTGSYVDTNPATPLIPQVDDFFRIQLKNFYLAPAPAVSRVAYKTNPYILADGDWDGTPGYDPSEVGDYVALRKHIADKYPGALDDRSVYWFQKLGWVKTHERFGPTRSQLALPTGGLVTGWASDNVWPNRWVLSSANYSVRRSRPVMRCGHSAFMEAVDSGALRLPAHLPGREVVSYDFQGEGSESGAFEDLGDGRVRYTVPPKRVLVLNYFRRSLVVNGVELRPASSTTTYSGAFLFGAGESVEFTLDGTPEAAGFTCEADSALPPK